MAIHLAGIIDMGAENKRIHQQRHGNDHQQFGDTRIIPVIQLMGNIHQGNTANDHGQVLHQDRLHAHAPLIGQRADGAVNSQQGNNRKQYDNKPYPAVSFCIAQ